MGKERVEKIFKTIPDAMKNIAGYIKGNFDKEGQEALNNNTGTIGLLIKVFAQDKIDEYFSNLSEEKCENFGTESYVKACMIQASRSIDSFKELAESKDIPDFIGERLSSKLLKFPEVNQEDLISILNPIYHPIIMHFKTYLRLLLSHAGLLSEHNDFILNNFNSNIENTVIEVFGNNDYDKHLKSLHTHVYQNNEAKLLWDKYK